MIATLPTTAAGAPASKQAVIAMLSNHLVPTS
jgi:hypothetical protein